MNTRKLFRFLMLMFLIVLTLSSRTYASATQIDANTIRLPVSDARLIIAEQASLEAENKAIREALETERANNKAILEKTEEYINASLEESKLLREQNAILQEQVKVLHRQVKIEKARGIGIGVVIGVIVGVIATSSM